MEMQAARRRQREMNNSRWAIDSDSDSSEDDRRVVRGAKEKFHDELRMIIRRVNNHVKVSDFSSLSDEYDKLLKCMQKSQNAVKNYGIPKFFISVLVELEAFLDEKFRDKEAIKKLSKAKATSFNTLRAKFRKSVEEYRDQMDDCRNNPLAYQDDNLSDDDSDSNSYSDSSDSDSSSSSSSGSDSRSVSGSGSDGNGSSSDESSSDSDSSSSSSSSEWSSYEDEYEDRHASALAKWGTRTKSVKKKESGKKANRQKQVKKDLQDTTVSGGANNNIPSGDLLSFEGEVTVDMIVEKVGEIVAARGKKGTDRQEQIRLLKKAAEISRPLSLQAYADVLTHLISAQFDTITGAFHCITSGIWSEICDNINILLDLVLLNNKDKRVYISGFQSFISSKDKKKKSSGDSSGAGANSGMDAHGNSLDGENANTDENFSLSDIVDLKEQDKSTVTFLVSFIERLDGESLKALQLTDVHSSEYKDRLVQSLHLLALLWRCYKICEERGYYDLVSSLSVHLINQLHFKNDSLAIKVWEFVRQILEKTVNSSLNSEELSANSDSSNTDCAGKIPDIPVPKKFKPSELITELVGNVYKYGDSKDKLRVLIQHVYNMALHDNYNEAVTLFQSIGVYDMALGSDVNIQILYNRSLVQLGLSAFRLGQISEAQQLLSEICMPNRNRELLAQGMSNMKSQERTPEQERAEKRRLLPYHMHLSLEVIDCIYLICSMLLEVPYLAYHKSLIMQNEASNSHIKLRPISKQFRRLLEQYERQAITGPPESLRDTIIAATRSLQLGKWRECKDYVFSLSIWDYNQEDLQQTQERLELNIKQEALRTYLFTYGHLYSSYSVNNLIEMFQLPREKIHSLLSKMMLKNELQALWDQTGEFVLLNHKQASKIQNDSLIVADKLLQFVDCNESMISSKGNASGGKNPNVINNRNSAGVGNPNNQGGIGPGSVQGGGPNNTNNTNSSGTGNQSFNSNYYSRKTTSGQYNKHKNTSSSSSSVPSSSSMNLRPIRV
ncbi:Eukaryotic translation initiation factor 3 subunit C [Cryptosporidium hominis]|uniref:Eukaryotic translation initiation factor 3 subunit C n=1 Tax=Cryptosporidium hominis TaxID=237895 RepID=A0ABX5BFC8_CRYHO|nr:Eukaryotic translation initiation factor 3 subunit C [Cryptosporidium hominis]|eukprot:PPS96371.1 Eukaryotic translation initiation factor 3 subunit C [Cryptosporidium hominis]